MTALNPFELDPNTGADNAAAALVLGGGAAPPLGALSQVGQAAVWHMWHWLVVLQMPNP